jgi:lysophospholipase L1-like esterase
MRLLLAIVLAVAIAVAVYAVKRPDDSPAHATGSATLVGDSLNVGIEPYLGDELPGWRVDAHDRVGRATQEGIDELRSLGGGLAPVVVVSLGTNDSDGSEPEFRKLVNQALAIVGPHRCLVWATVVRAGTPRTGFNQVLVDARSEHPNVRLVEWAALVGGDGELLAGDLVHGTPDGYARRAEETARAIRDCPVA